MNGWAVKGTERVAVATAALGWVVVGPLAALVAARVFWHDGTWLLLLANMFTTWLLIPAWAVLAGAAVLRRRALGCVALAVCVFHAGLWVPPLLPRSGPPLAGDGVRLLSANLLMVHPEPDALAAELEALDADVMVLQEFSSRWHDTALRRGWYERYPEHVQIVRDDSFGCAIFSRLPLHDATVAEMAGLPQLQATVVVDGREVDLLNVHALPPRIASYVPGHREALADVERWAEERRGSRPFVVTGDFNATEHSRFHRRLTRHAHDAWELAGEGFGHTAPNGLFPLPPMRLDHVYLSPELTVADPVLGDGVGSDHRPIVVTVGLR
jgi:endonuclease/exonuclease/phosphatase (EEP) superfamily protein YafD